MYGSHLSPTHPGLQHGRTYAVICQFCSYDSATRSATSPAQHIHIQSLQFVVHPGVVVLALEPPLAIVLERLLDLRLGVHHKGAVLDNGLVDGPAAAAAWQVG